jgi:hypothetical protein
MSTEKVLDFVIDQLDPTAIRAAKKSNLINFTIIFEDEDEELQTDPNQVHLHAIWKADGVEEKIYFRVGTDENGKVITVIGANQNYTPRFVIHVNGDDSWKESFNSGIKTLFKDPYLCIPGELD